ncbi:MAG: hypothetical protein GY820_25745 [Gammaproteobacteria bacterium]|nr:hypothetical protein [Gammaproteobacteria bacterium]
MSIPGGARPYSQAAGSRVQRRKEENLGGPCIDEIPPPPWECDHFAQE